jgi:hypothetical protein
VNRKRRLRKRSSLLARGILITIGLVLSACLPVGESSPSCTIFTVAGAGEACFGNNEDNDDARQGRIWFRPGRGSRHGVVLFGYSVGGNVDIPVGGMNDQGLVVDSNALGYQRVAVHPGKETYRGSFFVPMLEECATVEEAVAWAQQYDLPFLETQQAHVADRAGNAVVLGLDDRGALHVSEKTGRYLVSTNTSLARDALGLGRPGSRYETASTMLEAMARPTVGSCAEVLERTAMGIVMYSYVVDLQRGALHLFSRGDFSVRATLDVARELARGSRSYDIEGLVRRQAGGAAGLAGQVPAAAVLLAAAVAALGGLVLGLRLWLGRRPAGRFALVALFVLGGMVLLRTLLRIPIPLVPIPNLVTVTLYLSFTAALSYWIGATFRPWLAVALCGLGVVLGEAVHCLLYGPSGELGAYVVFAVASYVPATWIVSLLRRKRVLLGMILGGLWTFLGLYLPASYYYRVIVDWEEHVLFYVALVGASNLLSVPLAYLVVSYGRRLAGAADPDEWPFWPRNAGRRRA